MKYLKKIADISNTTLVYEFDQTVIFVRSGARETRVWSTYVELFVLLTQHENRHRRKKGVSMFIME